MYPNPNVFFWNFGSIEFTTSFPSFLSTCQAGNLETLGTFLPSILFLIILAYEISSFRDEVHRDKLKAWYVLSSLTSCTSIKEMVEREWIEISFSTMIATSLSLLINFTLWCKLDANCSCSVYLWMTQQHIECSWDVNYNKKNLKLTGSNLQYKVYLS